MSDPNCNAFDAALREIGAKRGSDDGALRAHAESCPRCAGLLAEEQTLNAAVRIWNETVPQIDLREPVVARWKAEFSNVPARGPATSPSKRPGKTWQRRILFGAVAAVLIVAAVALLGSPGTAPTTTPDRNSPDVARKTTPPAGPRPGTLSVAGDEGSEFWHLFDGVQTHYTIVSRQVAALQLPPLQTPSIWPDRDPNPNAPNPPEKTSDGWGTSLKPVERDVRQAFGFLRDAVPMLDDSST